LPTQSLTLSIHPLRLGGTELFASKHLAKFVSQSSLDTLANLLTEVQLALGDLPKEIKTEKVTAFFMPVAHIETAFSSLCTPYSRVYFALPMIVEINIQGTLFLIVFNQSTLSCPRI
jgi:hypothetical protein